MSTNAIMMPGERGLKWLLPLYLAWMKRYQFRLHYLVVGGWLPDYLESRPQDVKRLSACTGIHVQTRRMLLRLKCLGLGNVSLLPNFRNFPMNRRLSSGPDPALSHRAPLRLVYLSRVIPQKGLELAIDAVESINREHAEPCLSLDIWGPVPEKHREWFRGLIRGRQSVIHYCGVMPPEAIPDMLPDYELMVFPTRYAGEGFPGVIVDAFVSGLPVLASDWQDNGEIILPGVNGMLFTAEHPGDLESKLRWFLANKQSIPAMGQAAASMADHYHVDNVFPDLIRAMGLEPEGAIPA
ncbi:glycosyltransferase [Halomonas sp. LR5S13]|uniref:glycosyltransferase family 4 protein n=1 Tax=Halomonas rhizosphaerae TaxID=3043296 RepID=UPI0024A9EC8A|nr:glycosyltransferase [Halomonas rhizosphaerae]MDI5920853.1 glycosyltransferase [Halomonas rhizosphaerae]